VKDPNFAKPNRTEMNPMLTPQEHEIIELIAMEYTGEEIAKKLNISVLSVENHRKAMFIKFAVESEIGLLKQAVKLNWIKL
jgi:DNA-binding CsgD family transcriptional regulator